MRVCLGGTFDPFHLGHERLLGRALEVAGPHGTVFVGLVSDTFSRGKRSRSIRPYAERKAVLDAWLEPRRGTADVVVNALEDPFGPSATGEYDVLVASVETVYTGEKINAARKERDLPPLRVEVVPYVLGEDLLPISGTRIAAGRIDREGKRLSPLVVAVGSTNPVKVAAVRAAFSRYLPQVVVDVRGIDVPSGVPDQPFDQQTTVGAQNRAEAAFDAAREEGAEFGVGIEAGLVTDPSCEGWLDVQHCIIVDLSGYRTHGHGPGFHHPPRVEDSVSEGATIGDALGVLSGDPEIGKTQGAIGWLTQGRLDRTRLTEHAVEAALVPRVRRALYDIGQLD